MLFTSAVTGQARVGDWEFRLEGKESETKARIALTSAHPYSGSKPKPKLVISRTKPNSPVKLLIIDTHDKDNDKCDYKDWKIKIDATDIPVLGYTFEPAKTELKAHLGRPKNELWDLFRKGLKLTIEVEQKCDSLSGGSNPVSYTFSLRGSSAAYKFVLGGVE